MKVAVIGLGDMGSGLAKNLIANGFDTAGFDPSEARAAAFAEMGGRRGGSAAEAAAGADVVFLMVMNGGQARMALLSDEGALGAMAPDGVVALTATILPHEATDLGQAVLAAGRGFIDSPVSGGFPGAQGGTLTLMAAAPTATLDKARPALDAISGTLHVVGDQPGQGQVMKACLQSLIGSIFSATFEAAALAAKAGVKGQALLDVVSTSSAGCGVADNALAKIIDRQFEGTGSHIATMHKDLTIALDMARSLGVPLFTASTAMQLFQAGKTRHPNGDNWIVTRIMEDIVGAELHRDGAVDRSGGDT